MLKMLIEKNAWKRYVNDCKFFTKQCTRWNCIIYRSNNIAFKLSLDRFIET